MRMSSHPVTPAEAFSPAFPSPRRPWAVFLVSFFSEWHNPLVVRGEGTRHSISVPWQGGMLGTALASWPFRVMADGPGKVTWTRRAVFPSWVAMPRLFLGEAVPLTLQLLSSWLSPHTSCSAQGEVTYIIF